MANTTNKHFDIYETISNRIIEQLEKGVVPWHKPWSGTADGAYSRVTGKAYSLLNQFMLPAGEYVTFQQCKAEGGSIKKGAKSHMVVFWKMFTATEKDDEGNETRHTFPLLKYYNVFNVEDTTLEAKRNKPNTANTTNATAEQVIENYLKGSGVKLNKVKSNNAYYSPLMDSITMPLLNQFTNENEYYSTLFHEATHSTGHKSRLNRITKLAAFGNEEYSKEELVAEIGAAAILARLGLETKTSFNNSAAYINSWLKALKNDKRLVVSAAGKAEKAMELILSYTQNETTEEPQPEAEAPKAEAPETKHDAPAAMKKATFFVKRMQDGKKVAVSVDGYTDGVYSYYKLGTTWHAIHTASGMAVASEPTRKEAQEKALSVQTQQAIEKLRKSGAIEKQVAEFKALLS